MATERSKPEITVQFEALKQKAKEKGLPMFLGIPEHSRPTAEWNGGWSSFLEIAAQAEARVLYVEKVRFDSIDDFSDGESRVYTNLSQIYEEKSRLERQRQMNMRPSDRIRVDIEVPDQDSVATIMAKLTRWQEHKGEVVSLRCIWFKEAVAHEWQITAKWLEDWQLAVRQAVIEAQVELQSKQDAGAKEDNLRLHDYARQMAQHERFADAKSDAKRDFMAQQIFPAEDEANRHKIAELAALYYWWSVQPGEAANKDEKARQLHRRGESISTIAAALDMSTAKVKRAIQITTDT